MSTTITDPATTALGVCATCGAEMPEGAAFCPACGARIVSATPAAPAVAPAMPAPAEAGPVPAGLLKRGAAFFIDYMLLATVMSVVVSAAEGLAGGAAGPLAGLGMVALGQLYWAGLESGRWQASIGKQALRLVVVNVDGTRLTLNRALVRSALSIVPLFAACAFIFSGADVIGGFFILLVVPGAVLMAPFNARRQALHDLLTATMVARRTDA